MGCRYWPSVRPGTVSPFEGDPLAGKDLATHLPRMRHFRVALIAWLLTAAGATFGALTGSLFGREGRFLGATILGTLAVLVAIQILTARGWLDPERRKGGSIGGFVGLALGAPLALMNIHTPLIAIAAFSLVGVCVLLGAGPNAVR